MPGGRIVLSGVKNAKKYREKHPGKKKNPLTKSMDYDTMIIHTVIVCPHVAFARVDILAQGGEDVK